MKFIIQTLLAIAVPILVLCLPSRGQTNGTNGKVAADSVKKVQIEKQKLYRESFTVNANLIDSALNYVKKLVTIRDAEENNENYIFLKNCEAFVEILFAEWNRKNKGGKQYE